MPIHHELATAVHQAISNAQNAGALPAFDIPVVRVERPRDPSNGDYASPIAMQLARLARLAPLKIAQAIADHLPALDGLSQVEVVPPGFINIRLADDWLQNQVPATA